MALQSIREKIVAIVPAFNEGERLGPVLETLTSYPHFSEIVVVDDGSTDNTAEVARSFPVRLIENKENLGKGRSMDQGVKASTAPLLFFCDADIRGLTHDIIDTIVRPVAAGRVEMFVGVQDRKVYVVDSVPSLFPLLSGERALTRALWEKIPEKYKMGFQIETALNYYAKREGKGLDYQVFSGLTQTIKEKKYGFWDGLRGRIGMCYEVALANWQLQKSFVAAALEPRERPEND